MTPSLFGNKKPEIQAPAPVQLTNILERNTVPEVDRLMVEEEPVDYTSRKRSTDEMFHLIKDLLTRKFQDVERAYQELDESNTRRLTQENMYQLMKK